MNDYDNIVFLRFVKYIPQKHNFYNVKSQASFPL